MENKYGIKKVVGGFGRDISAEDLIPYTLNRTYLEHRQLRKILLGKRFGSAIEIGCGYGRNLPLLEEHSNVVRGIERDKELRDIAAVLNPSAEVILASTDEYKYVESVGEDLILTYTFLQHLTDNELYKALDLIRKISKNGTLIILCEETDPKKSSVGCWSRSPEEYAARLGKGFEIYYTKPRIIEATFKGRISGEFIVLKRVS